MNQTLSMILLLSGVFTALWILYRIRKSRVKMEDAIFWICMGAILIIMGVFPGVPLWVSRILGFQAPVNCIFLIVIALLIEKIFTLSIKQSQMEDKMETMAAEIALRSKNLEDIVETNK